MDKHYRKDIFLGDAHFMSNMFFRGVQVFGVQSKIFFVDKNQGNDNNSGLSWAQAFASITQAITAHTAYRETRAGQSVDTYIIIAPATYAEKIETLPMSCHMIGLGVLGTDKSTKISPVSGSAIAGTVSGLHFYNIRFEAKGSIPIIDFGICNNVIFENCQFAPAGPGLTCYIETDNSGELQIINCHSAASSTDPVITGFHFKGAGFLHAATIKGNIISGIKSGGTGIKIDSDCIATEAVIQDNIIIVPGAGKGINDNNGKSHCIGNKIFVGASGDCIDHAGGDKMLIGNSVNVNGAVRDEPKITTTP